jgi:hypothetical protein
LEGHWTSEHIFELKQCYHLYQEHRKSIQDCDKEIEKQLTIQIASQNDGEIKDYSEVKRKSATSIKFHLI